MSHKKNFDYALSVNASIILNNDFWSIVPLTRTYIGTWIFGPQALESPCPNIVYMSKFRLFCASIRPDMKWCNTVRCAGVQQRWHMLNFEITLNPKRNYISAVRGLKKMVDILQMTLWNACSWMKVFSFRLIFGWILFLAVQLTISYHCFNWPMMTQFSDLYMRRQGSPFISQHGWINKSM